MPTRVLLLVAVGLLATGSLATGQVPSVDDLRSMVVGVAQARSLVTAGVPLTSGAWGTDYITVSHGLRVGSQFEITYDGQAFDESAPVAACSAWHHGIDVLILRVASHQYRRVVAWGNPADLKAGDELLLLPRPEIQTSPPRVTFVHVNLLAWSGERAELQPRAWPREWQNVMVGVGDSLPGFSGSPWVKDGKVYGLHKGRVRPASTWFEVAETATAVHRCLQIVHYAELIPTR